MRKLNMVSKTGANDKRALRARGPAAPEAIDRPETVVAGLGAVKLERRLAQSADAASFIEGLRQLADHYIKPSRRRVRQGLRSSLEAAYAAVVAIDKLSPTVRNDVLSDLKGETQSRTNGGDAVRIILKTLMAYAGRNDRSLMTRDANALRYAMEQKIPVANFTSRLARKGESLRSWADRYADAHRRPKGGSKQLPTDRVEDHQQRVTKPCSRPEIDLKPAKQPGYYVHVLRHRSDGSVEDRGRAKLPKKLKRHQISDVLAAGATAAPQIESIS